MSILYVALFASFFVCVSVSAFGTTIPQCAPTVRPVINAPPTSQTCTPFVLFPAVMGICIPFFAVSSSVGTSALLFDRTKRNSSPNDNTTKNTIRSRMIAPNCALCSFVQSEDTAKQRPLASIGHGLEPNQASKVSPLRCAVCLRHLRCMCSFAVQNR